MIKKLFTWDVILPYLLILVSWGYFTFFVAHIFVWGIVIGITWTLLYIFAVFLVIKKREYYEAKTNK